MAKTMVADGLFFNNSLVFRLFVDDLFGHLWTIRSVICGQFVRLFVDDSFGYLWIICPIRCFALGAKCLTLCSHGRRCHSIKQSTDDTDLTEKI